MSSQWDELTQCLVLPTPRLLVESEQLFRHWTWPLAARPSFPPFHLQNVHHWFQILPKTGLYFPQRGQIGVFLDQISENNFILFFLFRNMSHFEPIWPTFETNLTPLCRWRASPDSDWGVLVTATRASRAGISGRVEGCLKMKVELAVSSEHLNWRGTC